MSMKWEPGGLKSPLARARGLGSAHEGADHWMAQRVTALGLIPLVIWFVYSVLALKGATHAEFTSWLAEPLNAILSLLLVMISIYHGVLGSQVVVEDYIHSEGFKMLKLIGMKLFYFGVAIACIFSILKIAL